ncbi:MAG TPA: ABC transporter substrate-binding protein [Gallionella sp.]|jgi:urea transport system substrate-binding protein|nr:ABC transporter substrate-binding protein [Gallionella sp.]
MKKLLSGQASVLFVAIAMAVALLFAVLIYNQYGHTKPVIKIGVLHSLTGTMAMSETPLVDAVRLAVEETNQSGGVNGQPIEMVVADCRSDAAYCAQQAEKLIVQEGVQALFGCWTSACRKAVKAVVEKHHHLLFYPLQYEGLEQSPDIIYTGATPNQQVIPMALWALQDRGKRFFLVGSDYIFSHTANHMVKDVLLAQDGQLLGERYVPLGETDMATVVQEIATQRPDFILNTLNGDSNLYFFRALHEAGISAEKIPVFSTSIAEVELAAIGADLVAGHYAAWNYFQSVDSEENKAFIARFRERFGKERVLDDPMEASYIGVKLWADSARTADAADLIQIKNILAQQSMSAPQGIVAIDFSNRHLWKTVRIGRARTDGQFDILWQSEAAVRPAPFPFYRSRSGWLAEQQLLSGAAR